MPTAAASGLPGYESTTVNGVFVAAATPPAIVNRLHKEFVDALNKQDVKQRLFDSGVEVVGNSPEQFAAELKTDVVRMGKVIREGNIREEVQR